MTSLVQVTWGGGGEGGEGGGGVDDPPGAGAGHPGVHPQQGLLPQRHQGAHAQHRLHTVKSNLRKSNRGKSNRQLSFEIQSFEIQSWEIHTQAANILLTSGGRDVFLVDLGLACKYRSDQVTDAGV